jgi:DNA-binding IscR family transcriptional regulator
VADAIEGPLYPMSCLDPDVDSCVQTGHCGLQELWIDLRQAVRGVFERTTIADMAARHRRLARPVHVFAPSELTRPLG